MKYPYLPLLGKSDTTPVIYPLLPITLIHKHNIIHPLYALIDSGSEQSYCHKVIGGHLKINFKTKKSVTSIAANGTKFTGFSEKVIILVGSRRIELSLTFSDQLNPHFAVILGQNGFFSNFQVCFNKSKSEFTLD